MCATLNFIAFHNILPLLFIIIMNEYDINKSDTIILPLNPFHLYKSKMMTPRSLRSVNRNQQNSKNKEKPHHLFYA